MGAISQDQRVIALVQSRTNKSEGRQERGWFLGHLGNDVVVEKGRKLRKFFFEKAPEDPWFDIGPGHGVALFQQQNSTVASFSVGGERIDVHSTLLGPRRIIQVGTPVAG